MEMNEEEQSAEGVAAHVGSAEGVASHKAASHERPMSRDIAVGAGGGQRVTLVDVSRMSPYQKIRYGLEKR